MLVIHGVWAYGGLNLWAEDSGRPAVMPNQATARPSRAPRPHPFGCDPDILVDALAEASEQLGDLARKAADDELTLRLPSGPGGPLPSPELGARQPDGAAKPPGRTTLAAWRVTALIFEPAAAQVLLGYLDEPDLLGAAQLLPGGSLQYFAAVGRLAADLAARGRVLPVLDTGASDGYWARWRPVLAGPDAQRARELAAAMPPLCRSFSTEGEPAAQVFGEALDELTDAAVRARLAADPSFTLLPAARTRDAADDGVAVVLERWAAALTGPDAEVEVTAGAQTTVAAQLAFGLWAWHDSAQEPAGPVRTCFRLIEPAPPDADLPESDAGPEPAEPDGEPAWRVELALQATDDPSLLLSAADIWSGEAAGGWAAAGIRFPEEDLLAGLGRASRLFPELNDELQQPAPDSVPLDTRGAFRFLKETGPLLAGAGFGVLLPDWVRKSRLGLKLTTRSRQAPAASAGPPKFGMADLVDFRYELAVGEDTLDPAELAELARLKIPLVRVRGQWVELDDRHLQAALKFLDRRRTGTMTAADAMLAGLTSEEDLPLVEVDADGWLGDLLSGQADRRLEPMQTPGSFAGELRPYQQRGLAWLSFLGDLGLGAILADDMGLGKTPQTLALLAHDKQAGATKQPTLLVCPMSLVGNWEREAARFAPQLRVHVHHGADRLAGDDLAEAFGQADLVITSYGVASRDVAELSKLQWARVVCDEAQNIKNSSTRQAQAVRALPAGSRIALTGTPVENRLADLWSIMAFTSPGLLGPADKFRQRFATPVERNADEEATERLRRLTGPFILRRLKTDKTIIADLPDKLEMKVWCNLTPEQASLYRATVDDMMARIEAADPGIERRGLVLATMAKLKQVCNHPAHLLGDGSRLDGRSGKLARLEEIGSEIVAAGDRALLFTQYAEFGHLLQPYLAARLGCAAGFLHGGTGKQQRDRLVQDFQEGNGPALLILSLKAGGTGLNLTAANHVIHVDRWWNPAVEDQATDRAFRIGQRRDVQVRKFVCVGTVEERIDAMIEEKKALAERVVGTGESWLTELSVADLRDVIALAPEAVSE